MKKILSVILTIACIMQCAIFTVAEANGFTDISGHWAESVILEMAEKGYATGNEDGTFLPDATISRAEAFALMARLAGYEDKGKEFTAKFTDMDGTEWYAPYVQFMYDKGFITSGITREKKFKGDLPATRELMAVTLVKISNINDLVKITTTLYDDHDQISDWAQRPIACAIEKGWITAADGLHLEPQKPVTRAEAIVMMSRVVDAIGVIKPGVEKIGDAFVGNSDYGVQTEGNYIVNDYTDKTKWEYIIKPGGVEAGYADAVPSHLLGEGSSPEDGCISYDVKSSGNGVINALQMKYRVTTENAIEAGRKYICGFKAKIDDGGSKNDTTLKFNVVKLRDVNDNNLVWSQVLTFNILDSTEWLNYEFEFQATEYQDDVVMLFQMGGDNQGNYKVYFDDFYWIPGEYVKTGNSEDGRLKKINTIIATDTNPADVQLSGGGAMEPKVYPELLATTTKESGLLLDYWLDPYRNKISPNSAYTAPALNSYTYRAGFAPYDYKDKNLKVPVSGKIDITTSVPVVSGTTASVNGKVALPEGYRLMDAGTLFYGGYWTENFNLFSEDIKNIPAFDVNENGEFASQAFMNTRYGVLARTYAIIENPEGNVMVQYSDTEYMHSPARPEKIEHHGIVYHELLGLFTGSEPVSPERCAEMIDELKPTGADIITVTPSEWKFNVWNSRTDGYWADYAKYSMPKTLSYAQEVNDYVLAGGDPVEETLAGTRKNGVYMFIDQRMNDHHYNNQLWWNTHSTFWKTHPKYWREDRNVTYEWDDTPDGGDTTERLFNYMNPEVRDYFYTLIEELVMDYDVDGLQMDFDRYYIYFKTGEEEMGMDILTEFVGRIREMVNRKSIDIGRDLQVSVRLEDTVEKVYGYGMDVEEWCRRDYVDILNVGDHYTNHLTVDIEGFKALAHNAKVFGELHYLTRQGAAVGGSTTGVRRHVTEHISWATAKNFYDRGADGISFFNFQYVPECTTGIYPELAKCFDRELLEKLEKSYVFTQNKGNMGFGSKSDLDFKFVIGEKLENHSSIVARLEYTGNATETETKFILNGVELKEFEREEVELFTPYSSNTSYAKKEQCKFYEIPMDVMINGENHFVIDTLTNPKGGVVACLQIAYYNN